MLICLDLHALCYMPLFPMLCSSFCSRMMLGLHAYMLVWCYWLWYAWIYVSMCLFPWYMVRSLSSHACMLGFVFFQAFILTSICLDLYPYMLICLDLHALCYMPWVSMLCSSFCSRMMLGLHAHMLVWCYWICLAWIYVSMCLFLCYMVRSLSSRACMLGSMFFHVYMLGFYMFTCMFLCLYV